MAKFSDKLLRMLCDFMVDEVEDNALYGITYTMKLKGNPEDEKEFEKYMNIRYEATQCGFASDQVFMVKALSNGWVFDVDIKTAKQILVELSKTITKDSKERIETADIINKSPDERRNRDSHALVSYIVDEVEKGNNSIKFAIYNRNSTSTITVTAMVNGVKNRVKLSAYALKVEDLKPLFDSELTKHSIHVKKISIGDILPNKNGVLCTIITER